MLFTKIFLPLVTLVGMIFAAPVDPIPVPDVQVTAESCGLATSTWRIGMPLLKDNRCHDMRGQQPGAELSRVNVLQGCTCFFYQR
jgi:hypothetical protein